MQVNQTVKPHPVFVLRQRNPDCYYIGVSHSFPHPNPANDIPLDSQEKALPSFNGDCLHFTPSFVLSSDRDYYRLNVQFQRQKFNDKMQQAEGELSNSELNVVDPVPNFCQICKAAYPNYSLHIKEKGHCRALALTKGSKWINQLCAAAYPKEKQIRKQGSSGKELRGVVRVKKKGQCLWEQSQLSKTSNPCDVSD